MTDLQINLQPFWYALLDGEELVEDSDGHLTGERRLKYTDPVKFKANISPARGFAEVDIFGADLQYDRTILTSDMSCPIEETSILWIGTDPVDGDENAVPYNYTVTRIARGLDSIVYAVKKVELK